MTDKQYDKMNELIIKLFSECTSREEINEECSNLIYGVEWLRDQVAYEKGLEYDYPDVPDDYEDQMDE